MPSALGRCRRGLPDTGGTEGLSDVVTTEPDQPDQPPKSDLDGLEKRIEALREARRPPKRRESKYTAASLAWRMVLELVVGMAIGLGLGWWLDRQFGTLPIFLAVFGIFGFAAGVRTMMRSAEEVRRREAETKARAEKD